MGWFSKPSDATATPDPPATGRPAYPLGRPHERKEHTPMGGTVEWDKATCPGCKKKLRSCSCNQ